MSSVATNPDSVSNLQHWFDDSLMFGGFTAATLIAEHAVLWDDPQRLPRPAAYAVGTFTLGLGLLGWVLRNRQADALTTWLAAGVITATGGAAVISAYYVRDVTRKLRHGAQQGGQLHGRIAVLRQESPDGHYRAAVGDVRR
jgi:hypothetical protein